VGGGGTAGSGGAVLGGVIDKCKRGVRERAIDEGGRRVTGESVMKGGWGWAGKKRA